MKLTYPLLLNAKPQSKPYRLTDRDSLYLFVSIKGTKTWKFDYLSGAARQMRLERCRRFDRAVRLYQTHHHKLRKNMRCNPVRYRVCP
jgi:hypothetical protein